MKTHSSRAHDSPKNLDFFKKITVEANEKQSCKQKWLFGIDYVALYHVFIDRLSHTRICHLWVISVKCEFDALWWCDLDEIGTKRQRIARRFRICHSQTMLHRANRHAVPPVTNSIYFFKKSNWPLYLIITNNSCTGYMCIARLNFWYILNASAMTDQFH